MYHEQLFSQLAYPESAKKTDNLTLFFALLGSVLLKAGRRMFLKLTPDKAETIDAMARSATKHSATK